MRQTFLVFSASDYWFLQLEDA